MVIKFNKRSLINFKYCPFALSLSKGHNFHLCVDLTQPSDATACMVALVRTRICYHFLAGGLEVRSRYPAVAQW